MAGVPRPASAGGLERRPHAFHTHRTGRTHRRRPRDPRRRILGEVRQLPGCLAQADTLEELAEAIQEAFRDYFAEPGVQTEETARALAAIQGSTEIPPGPYPLRYDYQPPPSWTEADEDE